VHGESARKKGVGVLMMRAHVKPEKIRGIKEIAHG